MSMANTTRDRRAGAPKLRLASNRAASSAPVLDGGSNRLSRQAWIDAAVAKLTEDSVDALRVDDLADRLGVTKGSFYWHFENREALINAVLDWWYDLMTEHTSGILDRLPPNPRARLSKLIAMALSPRSDVPGGPFELSLRDWARRDQSVRRIVSKVDAARETIVARLYRDLGLGEREAADWAHAHMAYVIGDAMTRSGAVDMDIGRRRRIAEALLIPGVDPDRSGKKRDAK